MYKKLIFAALLLWSPLLWGQSSLTKEFKEATDSLKVRLQRRTGVNTPLVLNRVTKRGSSILDFYFSQDLAEYPYHTGDITWLRDEWRLLFPPSYRGYTLGELYAGKQKTPVNASLAIDPIGNSGKPSSRKFRTADYRNAVPALVRSEENWPLGLSGRHIALWQSHGRYYEAKTERWEWQRAATHRTLEDVYTQSYVLPFLIPMLESAGAVVMTPRERDTQVLEVVCDNDPAFAGERAERVRRRGNYHETGLWTDAGIGFADRQATYRTSDNPFRMGSARMIRTVKGRADAHAPWRPDIPRRGRYGVYVSYKSLGNSVTDAEYTVRHLGGESIRKVNQRIGGGTWVYLGHFDFDKGRDGCVLLSNHSAEDGVVTADGVRFGGGMGRVRRAGRLSGMPAYTEGAYYNLIWSGADSTAFTDWDNDYTRDYAGRGRWCNWLSGRSRVNPDAEGLGIPLDLSLAFHTDAGVTPNDSIVGTLAIYTLKCDGSDQLPSGESRLSCRALSDAVQTQVVDDIRAQWEPAWTRRGTWDRSYSESRTTGVPAMLLELLAHQNFADMRYGLDPAFRFTVCRAVYKGVLKFLSNRYGCPYRVQPLPVHAFASRLSGNKVTLSWAPTEDPLEPTAAPEGYLLQTRVDDGAFDEGVRIDGTSTTVTLQRGHLYSWRVIAWNPGGKSFPSEILSAGIPAGNPKQVVVVNNFTRVSAPAWFDTPSYAGFMDRIDSGVPWEEDLLFAGEVNQFDRSCVWTDDDNPGFGGSFIEYAGRKIGGNTFDYPAVHGRALMKAGYSFSSMSMEAFCLAGDIQAEGLDLICGKQVTVPLRAFPERFTVFPEALQQALRRYAEKGGNILLSGAYIGTDAWDRVYPIPLKDQSTTQAFIQEVLGYKWVTNFGDTSGRINPYGMRLSAPLSYNRSFREGCYRVENPDGILPASDKGRILLRYGGTDISAGVGYETDGRRVIAFGFPLEALTSTSALDELMQKSMEYLIH